MSAPRMPSRTTEHADPHEQHRPVPRVVTGLALALVVWAIAYIATQGPDSAASLGDGRDPPTLAAGAAAEGAAVDGRQLYTAHCQACHQASGQGLPGVFPPLAGSEWVTGDPQVLAQIVLHGMTGPIEVRATAYQGAMPAFGAQLGNAEIAAVLSFVRSEWGNRAGAIHPADIETGRASFPERRLPWNGQQELMQAAGSKPAP